MNTKRLTDAVAHLQFPAWTGDKEEYRVARKAWGQQISELEKEWKGWLGDQYASDINTSGRELIFSRAWEVGHSSGYHEVEMHYIDLADFGRAFLSAVI